MAGFDPFANQGGPAAWDPDTPNTSRELADRLLGEVEDQPVATTETTPEDRAEAAPTDPPSPTDDGSYFSPAFTD